MIYVSVQSRVEEGVFKLNLKVVSEFKVSSSTDDCINLNPFLDVTLDVISVWIMIYIYNLSLFIAYPLLDASGRYDIKSLKVHTGRCKSPLYSPMILHIY